MYLEEIRRMARAISVDLTDIHIMDCEKIGVLDIKLFKFSDGTNRSAAIVTSDECAALRQGVFSETVRKKIEAALLRLKNGRPFP